MHHQRLRKGRDMDAPPQGKSKRVEFCTIEGCETLTLAKGLCTRHYSQAHYNYTPKSNKRVKGTGSYSKGYLVITRDGKRVLQHRAVIEQYLGRELQPFENVHHVNGVRDDNRIENLELWVKPQPAGRRVEDLVEWVVEHYTDEVSAALSVRKG
jgi:hypothetical protein